MSKSNPQKPPARRAVALQYEGTTGAPVVVASGMNYLAEKIVEVASDSGVPVYEDNSLATILSQLQLGQEIPPSLYHAIVDIYVYFLSFDPNDPDGLRRKRNAAGAPALEEDDEEEDEDEEEEDED